MSKFHFYTALKNELKRIDLAKTAKRNEKIITGFTSDTAPRAIINYKKYRIFNSNDYLGLRFTRELRRAEHQASETFGTGPGAVRFISGTLMVYKDLEEAIALFHKRPEGMVFSSAFAANLAVISCLAKGQNKDSLISADTLIISDELNHRSIIDGIRLSGLGKEQKQIYSHLDYDDLKRILDENKGKYKRVLVITDGVFSMLGEYADIKTLRSIVDSYDQKYDEGVLLIVDDSHGVGGFGKTGRGCEEVSGARADVLIGTFGKAFGADGGYVVADKEIITYLRESAATYIYSNSISPGVAASALAALSLLRNKKGNLLLKKLSDNIHTFKSVMKKAGFIFAAESIHPIQPILIGDPGMTKLLVDKLFNNGILVTSISYPIVPAGKDEIRVQISAAHTKEDIEYFMEVLTRSGKELKMI